MMREGVGGAYSERARVRRDQGAIACRQQTETSGRAGLIAIKTHLVDGMPQIPTDLETGDLITTVQYMIPRMRAEVDDDKFFTFIEMMECLLIPRLLLSLTIIKKTTSTDVL